MAVNVNAKIVIIGCGISGVAAAHRLVKAGFHNVRIVEATARSGGRIKTGRFGEKLYSFIKHLELHVVSISGSFSTSL